MSEYWGKKYLSPADELGHLRYEHAAIAFQLAALRLYLALKAGFNPDQPRVPAGRPGGGQWTDGDDGAPIINDPPIEEVYPELLIVPLLRIPRLLNAWRLWVLSRREAGDWTLGAHKTPKRWAKQPEERNWTPDDITETIKYGRRYKAPNKVRKAPIRAQRQRGMSIMAVMLFAMTRREKYCR